MPEESKVDSPINREDVDTEPMQEAQTGAFAVAAEKTAEPAKDFFVAEEYGESFSALKDAMTQGRDLKKKRKALEEYNKTLETLKAAHADRVNIAANFESVVAEQRSISEECEASIGECMRKSQEVDARIAQANDELAQMKKSQAESIKPLEDELNRREAMFKSAKDEYKQVKAQRDSLGLFDGEQEEGNLEAQAHDRIVDDVEAKRDAAKEACKSAQKALDEQEKANKAEQKLILDSIKKLNSEKDKIAKESAEFQKRADAAKDRIAFCNHVAEHPEETEAMQQRIAENERTAASMGEQIDQLTGVHEKSREASSKARNVVIIAAIAIVVFIILFIIVANR